MKARQLRIGNLVNVNGEPMTIYQIEHRSKTIYRINDIDIDDRCLSDKSNPILLTPEILEKCEFKKGDYHQNYYYHTSLSPHIVIYSDGFLMEVVDDIRVSESFHYLHQLQNLYFALTGEELKVNEA